MTEIDAASFEPPAPLADPSYGLDGETMERIVLDVSLGIPIEQSKLTYGDAEKQFRQDTQTWVDSHPDAGIDLPFDAASADVWVPEMGEG